MCNNFYSPMKFNNQKISAEEKLERKIITDLVESQQNVIRVNHWYDKFQVKNDFTTCEQEGN